MPTSGLMKLGTGFDGHSQVILPHRRSTLRESADLGRHTPRLKALQAGAKFLHVCEARTRAVVPDKHSQLMLGVDGEICVQFGGLNSVKESVEIKQQYHSTLFFTRLRDIIKVINTQSSFGGFIFKQGFVI